MATAHALYDAPAPRPPPPFPLPDERFASLAYFDLALSRAAYGHRYPFAPIQPSSVSTFTSRCPLPASPGSYAQWFDVDNTIPVRRPPCTFTFVAVEQPSASSDVHPVVVVLACPTHSCGAAERAARVRNERVQAAERLVETARAVALVERSASAQEEQDDETRREAEEREQEQELERLACRARELDEEQAWVEGYALHGASSRAISPGQACELDELDGAMNRDADDGEEIDYCSIEDRAAFEGGADWRWRGDGGIDFGPGRWLTGASAPQASVLRAFKAPRRRSSPADEEIPELE
ncbi:hypothetical protein JCM9279_004585 [Rhodotorula babjevae]